MLAYGSKPTDHTSALSGTALTIYTNRITNGFYGASLNTIILFEQAIVTVVNNKNYPETETNWHNRVFNAKLDAWIIAKSIIDDFKSTAEVDANYNSGTLVVSSSPVSSTEKTPTVTGSIT